MNKKPHSRLWLHFAGLVFATVAGVFLLVSALWFFLYAFRIVPVDPPGRHAPVLVLLAGSLQIGCAVAGYVGRLIIRPIQNIGNAFDELSKGNFSVRVCERERIPEIREMAQRFNAMACDLSHIETLRSDFVANVSHEFKTPIAAIEGYATLLQDRRLSAERRDRYVEKILENSRRLTNLSGNILLLSRLENQETVPDRKEYRLDEQLRRAVLLLENRWTEKNITFDMELPRQNYYGSEPLLDQVWGNILDNAIRYSPAGGVIQIGIQKTAHRLTVRIADQGAGMSQEVQKHMFEKFYQGDSSRKAEGNGLGLALVKRIVELCRGEISVESAPGAGTAFSVSLPVTAE